ncbi:predicted protein [Streptomyces filamentosus NRRL 15998]|uniref:Predicted protein n=1 Tax=Streptomyces filamentosus NRRL 15998 TaxID=457431 RepID=D6AC34_STRFL|nr:predicted protein [Streptomyces filamentosus NRRL 15998]
MVLPDRTGSVVLPYGNGGQRPLVRTTCPELAPPADTFTSFVPGGALPPVADLCHVANSSPSTLHKPLSFTTG